VRNLAQRSASAVKEIKTLIGDSVEKVDTGTSLVNQAGATMDEILTSVQRVTDIMAEIMSATTEQSAGIEQVTQQNAALVEQASAAAAELQSQSAHLARSVALFKLSGDLRQPAGFAATRPLIAQ
jgi:methyl-accepting chemotaxis protein